MGLHKIIAEGTWWLRSKSDPRWNADGRGSVGCGFAGVEASAKLTEFKALYGEPPEDLEIGYMKD